MLTQRGAATAAADMVNAQLVGRVNEATKSVEFHLRGQLRVQKVGARLRVLSGHAALSEKAAGDGWHVELVADGRRFCSMKSSATAKACCPLDLGFTAAIDGDGDWHEVWISEMPAGAVVPLRLEGSAGES